MEAGQKAYNVISYSPKRDDEASQVFNLDFEMAL